MLFVTIFVAGSSAAQGATQVVRMVNFNFQPKELTINSGDTVVWTNTTTTAHDVTSTTGAWETSGLFTRPETFSVTFTEAGTYNYFCTPHRSFGMTGVITVQAAANQPPVVALTSPAPGTTMPAPATIVLEASANDPDGTIASVEFFAGDTSLGSVAATPYSLTVSNLAAATYNFIAKATDNLGLSTTSAAVSVTVSDAANQPPVVSLTSPAPGTTMPAPATIVLEASANDPDGTIASVEFFAGDTSLGSVAATPYSLTASNLAAGTYNFTAKATDNLGLSTTSAAVSVTVTAASSSIVFDPTLTISNGFITLRLTVTPGMSYAIESAADLAGWQSITNFVANQAKMDISVPLVDPGKQFFRAKLLPTP
jgi:plastocyanin